LAGTFEEERRSLVEYLKRAGYIRSEKVERAMLTVPREEFVPADVRSMAYLDRPLPIGWDQTISAPSIVAYMTELLSVGPGDKVLEVGTGSGYQSAVLAEVVAPTNAPKESWGQVISIERIPELAEFARSNLERTGYADRVTVLVGDGTLGYQEEAPYKGIIVTAAAPKIPKPLVEQLDLGGRLVIPVGPRFSQVLMVVYKGEDGEITYTRDLEVVFVPLVGKHGWDEDKGWFRLGL